MQSALISSLLQKMFISEKNIKYTNKYITVFISVAMENAPLDKT